MGGLLFFVFRFNAQSAILNFMRFAPIASMLVMSLALNAQTIQGKVVRVYDGDTITILDEAKVEEVGVWYAQFPLGIFHEQQKKEKMR